jgi:hypothetical protein
MSTPIYFVDKDNAIFELSKFVSFNESFDDPRCTAAATADDRTFIINADLSLVSKALFDNNFWTTARTETETK